MQITLPIYESIIALHDVVLEVSGGLAGIRDNNIVLGAVDRPKTHLAYTDNCDIHIVCAVLLDSLARNHAFSEGNKRTALMTALYTYRVNGYYLNFNLFMNEEYEMLALWVVNDHPSIIDISAALKELAEKYKLEGIDKMAQQLKGILPIHEY